MAYKTPPVGTVLPAQQNTTVKNAGPVHSPDGNNEYLQADAQDKAWIENQKLLEEWHNAEKDSPEYAQRLGASLSWAVVVAEAEAGGVNFDRQRIGPALSLL